ncbi:MAG: hypothetical protein IJI41_05540 [Anaerolineaceae bacterium]|nr:hypothetical protein [Anaerolineaceae bacterium]
MMSYLMKIFRHFLFGKETIDKAAWAAAVFETSPKHPEKIDVELLKRITEMLVFQDLRIINESLDIIQKTRNADTKQGRIKLTLERYKHLKSLLPFVDDESQSKILTIQNRIKSLGLISHKDC